MKPLHFLNISPVPILAIPVIRGPGACPGMTQQRQCSLLVISPQRPPQQPPQSYDLKWQLRRRQSWPLPGCALKHAPILFSRAPRCFDIFYSLISCTVIFKTQTRKMCAIIPITGDAVFISEEAWRAKETKKEKRWPRGLLLAAENKRVNTWRHSAQIQRKPPPPPPLWNIPE